MSDKIISMFWLYLLLESQGNLTDRNVAVIGNQEVGQCCKPVVWHSVGRIMDIQPPWSTIGQYHKCKYTAFRTKNTTSKNFFPTYKGFY
jgi:hypothetical protein